MSASQSKLSDPKYGYDMVVATTQAAVNATMKEWLSKYVGKPFTQAYLYNPNLQVSAGGPSVTDFEQLKKDLGFDPFTLPKDINMYGPEIGKLRQKKFMYAFQAELGLPDFPLDQIPPVIQFDREGSYVTYNMVCKSFKIIAIQQVPYEEPIWLNIAQEEYDKPWVFKFTVNLDMRKDNIANQFHNLPEATQKEIENLGKDMFSVQQLFLDLNAAGLRETLEIKGVAPSIQLVLSEIFVKNYLKSITADGGIMLGYSAVSKEPFPNNVSMIPTSMNFEVCSYKNERGEPTTDFNAYTLNYLIMCKNRPMPAPVQFAWNWVEKDKVNQYSGVMAINRASFITFLHDLLSPSLKAIVKRPNVYFHCNCLKADFTFKYEDDYSNNQFNIVQNGGAHILTFSHTKFDQSSDTTYCGVYGTWGNLESNYDVKSDVYLEAARIRVETTITVFMHLNVCGGVSEGNFAKKKLITYYNIGADLQGRLTVRKDGPPIEDHSDNPRTDVWAKIITFGQVTDMVDGVRKTLKEMVERFLTDDSKQIEYMLNGSGSWVFPGARTFAFKDAQFSDTQDLVTNVLYIKPNTPPKQVALLLKTAKAEDANLETARLQALQEYA